MGLRHRTLAINAEGVRAGKSTSRGEPAQQGEISRLGRTSDTFSSGAMRATQMRMGVRCAGSPFFCFGCFGLLKGKTALPIASGGREWGCGCSADNDFGQAQ